MKKIIIALSTLFLLAINTPTEAKHWYESDPDPSTAVLPVSIGQAEVDWFKGVADSSGYSDRLYSIADTARTALTTATRAKALANDALDRCDNTDTRLGEVADTARTALSRANRTPDFAGKTFARIIREYALDYVRSLAMDSTSSPAVKGIGVKLAAKKSLTSKEEELVAKLYLNFLQSRQHQTAKQAAPAMLDSAKICEIAREQIIAMVGPKLVALDSTDSTLTVDIRHMAHNTAAALGAENAEGSKPTREDRKAALAWLATY